MMLTVGSTGFRAKAGVPGPMGLGCPWAGPFCFKSLAVEKRFSAVVADSPFAEFSSIAKYRVDQRIPLPAAAANLISGPVIFDAFLYGRLRYGIDLTRVSPLGAVKAGKHSHPADSWNRRR